MEELSSKYLYLLWSVLVPIIFLIFYRILKFLNYRRRVNKLKGPTGLPFFGIFFEVWRNANADLLPSIIRYWDKFSSQGVFRITLLHRAIVYLCKPEYVQVLLSSNEQINKTPEYKFMLPWLGNGILLKTGKEWHARRKLLTPTFHFKILEDFYGIMNEHAEKLVEKLSVEDGKESFSFFPYISRSTLGIICESAMGHKMHPYGKTIDEYLASVKIVTHLGQLRSNFLINDNLWNLSPKGIKQNKYIKKLHDFTNSVIKARTKERAQNKKQNKSTDEKCDFEEKKRLAFLDLILEISESGKTLSSTEIREEVDTIMFAGHDTTATAITWTLYMLGHHQNIQEQLRQEIRDIIGDNPKTPVTAEHLSELKYLDRVIKESLRLYSPAPIVARDITEDMKFDNHIIPAGTTVLLFVYKLHRNPEVFPDPERFDPDRFLPEEVRKRHPYAYIPFSAGPRNCLGQRFAVMDIKILLCHLIRSYNFESLESPDELKLIGAVVLGTENGVLMKIKKI